MNPLHALSWLGRQGTRAIALSIVLGLMMPPVSAFLRHGLEETVFVLLIMAFLRVDTAAVKRRLKRPGLVIAALLWIMLVVPLAVCGLALMAGLGRYPDLMLILFMVIAAPSVMSSPAFAFLLGLDGALSLTVLVIASAATPFTAPMIAGLLLSDAGDISTVALAIRLFGLLAGSMLVAAVIRRIFGDRRLAERRAEIDGINVIILFIFAIAAMDGVAGHLIQAPWLVALVLAAAFAMTLVIMAATMVAFAAIDRADAFNLAISTGNRNLGLIVAALGGNLPDLVWLYFALGQFPIYILPWLLQPIARRLVSAQLPAGRS